MFKIPDSELSFSQKEAQVLEFWQTEDIFKKSLQNRADAPVFFFYDGPPFATGLPHYGHILASTIKDVIPRFKTMAGYYVERKFGWDCHGVPVEFEAEKELKTRGKADIEKLGIDKFNEYCRSIVLRYAKEWRTTINRIGRWADMDNEYKTMDKDFMETIWWVFSSLYEKKLIYLSNKIVAYSPRLNTPLSNFEVNLGYKMTKDPAVTVKFKVLGEQNTFFLAWTTTPWTLISNAALTVGKDITYSLVEYKGEKYYLAKDTLDNVFKGLEYKLIKTLKGSNLENIYYIPLFKGFINDKTDNAFFVTLGDYVKTDTGTGIVHTAPFFGEDDFATAKKYSLKGIMPIDDSGYFDQTTGELAGLFFKDADAKIIQQLKQKNLIFKHEQIEHSYPFCWRTDVPLMYRAIPSWFLDVSAIKDKLLANNQTINWQPEHIKNGRMGKWLESARDWAISRNRFWGTTIPVWVCQECENQINFSSIKALEDKSQRKINDIHRHFIDDIVLECPKCKGKMQRTPEVLDCWFESGSMPYGQKHYPFKNQDGFEKSFPADFISEGLDQTRGWFYTLMVLSTALFDKPAFKNCIVSGLILAEDGQKMSKRLKNYPAPEKMLEKYGADAIRFYMLNSGAIKAEELKFIEQGLLDTIRSYFIPLWNVLNFFVTYANIDGWAPKSETIIKKEINNLKNPLDIWIISSLERLTLSVTNGLNSYKLNDSIAGLLSFMDNLTNWYLRRSRRRFWKSETSQDKEQAYSTTYFVLLKLSKILAPVIPFFSESLYLVLKQKADPASVHLCDYPLANKELINDELDAAMQLAMKICNLGRSLRTRQKIKIRQPLSSLTVFTKDKDSIKILKDLSFLITEELNIKKLLFSNTEEKLVNYSARPNLPVLGKKYGKYLPLIKETLAKQTSEKLIKVVNNQEKIFIKPSADLVIELGLNELLIDRTEKKNTVSISEQDLTIVMDFNITEDLNNEGLVRELINRIQNYRKQLNLKVYQLIKVNIQAPENLVTAAKNYQAYIKDECLCADITFDSKLDNAKQKTAVDIDELKLKISIEKA